MNTPNRISMLRIALIPVYIILMYTDFWWSRAIAGVVFILASLTDSLDGYFARKNNQVTDLGKFLDPLADKLLVLTAIIILSARFDVIPAWAVVVITARELIVTSLRTMAALKNRVVAADIYGKMKTLTQVISVAMMHMLTEDVWFYGLANVIFYLSVGMTVLSGVNYVIKNMDVIQQ